MVKKVLNVCAAEIASGVELAQCLWQVWTCTRFQGSKMIGDMTPKA